VLEWGEAEQSKRIYIKNRVWVMVAMAQRETTVAEFCREIGSPGTSHLMGHCGPTGRMAASGRPYDDDDLMMI
jgi:hypothetical protein